MSTNNDSEAESSSTADVSAAEDLAEKRRQIQQEQKLEELEEQATVESGRSIVTEETESGAPDDSLEALLNTEELEFRGVGFTFTEPGDAIIQAQQFNDEDVESGTQAAEFVYETLGEKSLHKDEEFWRHFDLGDEGGDGVMDLFNRYVEAFQDIPDEEREKIDEFQSE